MRKSNSRRDLGRKRGMASARVWEPREPDADTLRRRALHDARGQVIREGVTYRGDGSETPWRVCRSLRGRVDQFDVIVAGRVWRTGGPRKLLPIF